MCSLHRVICRLTAAVCAPSIPLTAGRARSARPEANERCACGSRWAAASGLGALTGWEPGGQGRGRAGGEGVDVDFYEAAGRVNS
jgi:hypothetical protein